MPRLEYYVDIGCDLKKTAGGMDNLLTYGKMFITYETLSKQAAVQYPGQDPNTIPYFDKLENRQKTLGELKQQVEWLAQWKPTCAQCPLAFRKEGGAGAFIGCFAGVECPIGVDIETLLALSLEQLKGLPPGHQHRAFLDYILNNNVTGQSISAKRAMGTAYFAKTTPGMIQLPDGRYVTTDQIFELLFTLPKTPQIVKAVIDPFLVLYLGVCKSLPPDKQAIVAKDPSCVQMIAFTVAAHMAAERGGNIVAKWE
jgi:hypothetical protein